MDTANLAERLSAHTVAIKTRLYAGSVAARRMMDGDRLYVTPLSYHVVPRRMKDIHWVEFPEDPEARLSWRSRHNVGLVKVLGSYFAQAWSHEPEIAMPPQPETASALKEKTATSPAWRLAILRALDGDDMLLAAEVPSYKKPGVASDFTYGVLLDRKKVRTAPALWAPETGDILTPKDGFENCGIIPLAEPYNSAHKDEVGQIGIMHDVIQESRPYRLITY